MDQCPHRLQVGSEYSLGSVVRMADIVSHGMSLAAHFADPSHSGTPFVEEDKGILAYQDWNEQEQRGARAKRRDLVSLF